MAPPERADQEFLRKAAAGGLGLPWTHAALEPMFCRARADAYFADAPRRRMTILIAFTQEARRGQIHADGHHGYQAHISTKIEGHAPMKTGRLRLCGCAVRREVAPVSFG